MANPMTPQLAAAIAAIQPLSRTEREQVLSLLLKSNTTNLVERSQEFWQGQTIAQLQEAQKTKPIQHLKDLAADFWPEEDSIEDFLVFLQTQRQEVTRAEV
jgi:hypothetical protein